MRPCHFAAVTPALRGLHSSVPAQPEEDLRDVLDGRARAVARGPSGPGSLCEPPVEENRGLIAGTGYSISTLPKNHPGTRDLHPLK